MGKLGVTVGIVGGGSMGGAIARGLVESGELDASAVRVADSDPARVEALASCGIAGCADASDLLSGGPDVVILAVKPQVIGDVMADIVRRARGPARCRRGGGGNRARVLLALRRRAHQSRREDGPPRRGMPRAPRDHDARLRGAAPLRGGSPARVHGAGDLAGGHHRRRAARARAAARGGVGGGRRRGARADARACGRPIGTADSGYHHESDVSDSKGREWGSTASRFFFNG